MSDCYRPTLDRWVGVRPKVVDETLRDGLQSPSAIDPPLDRKIAILHAMVAVGVDRVSVGLPAAGPRAVADGGALAREIDRAKLPVTATAAARTTEGDVQAVATVSQRGGIPVDVYAFLGCSPIRCYVENWGLDFLTERIRVAGATALRASLPYCVVLEDTTRTPPTTLRTLFSAAVDAGAMRICLCDTSGHADPHGARALVVFARNALASLGAGHIELDWHGHNDRGLSLANALEAARAGVTGVHGTAGGVGERTGNTPMEPMLHHLAALGARDAPCASALSAYSLLAAREIRGVELSAETP